MRHEALVFKLVHVFVGAICGVALLVTIYFSESELVEFIAKEYRKRYVKKRD